MRSIFYIALLSFGFNFYSCLGQEKKTGAENKSTAAQINESISADDFEKKLAVAGIQLIDVRTPEEFAGGHLKNAQNMNINGENFGSDLNKLDKTKPVLVYCLSGGRSGKAANKMKELGFTEVYNMSGGIMKWQGAGKPVTTENGATVDKGLTMEAFQKEINSKQFVLVDYNATWCGPCKKIAPILEKFSETRKEKLKLFKVDADQNKTLLKTKGISEIPVLELYQNGKLIWTHKGIIDEETLIKETKL